MILDLGKEVVGVIAQHLQSIVDDATIGRVIRKASAVSLSRAYQNLNDAEKVAAIVSKLLDGGLGGADGQEDDNSGGLLGLQLCFDLMESGNQSFANHCCMLGDKHYHRRARWAGMLVGGQKQLAPPVVMIQWPVKQSWGGMTERCLHSLCSHLH